VGPLASSGKGADIVESSSSEEFGILSWPTCPFQFHVYTMSVTTDQGSVENSSTQTIYIVIYASGNILQRV
jgi:hypothetical protein